MLNIVKAVEGGTSFGEAKNVCIKRNTFWLNTQSTALEALENNKNINKLFRKKDFFSRFSFHLTINAAQFDSIPKRRPARHPSFNIKTKILNNNKNPFQFKSSIFSLGSPSALRMSVCVVLYKYCVLEDEKFCYPCSTPRSTLFNPNGNGFSHYGKVGKYR